jgi:pimeloyl-ACP methyl ester carboxylesterase
VTDASRGRTGRDELRVPVAGGELHVARFGSGAQTLLGIHGITASSMGLLPVARHLGAGYSLIAPDLRGRGGSANLPGPFGMRAHADDCAAVIDAVAGEPVVVVGESMGGYVAVVLAARHPQLVERLVLVDGGLPIPVPPAMTADLDTAALARVVLGPALDRLSTQFASLEAYLDFWRDHPAFGEDWNPDMEAYFEYDLEPSGAGFRSRVREAAVLEDAGDLFVDPQLISDSLAAVDVPITLLRAPRNLLNQPAPMIPEAVAGDWQRRLPKLSVELVEDVNHYTLMMGSRGAAIIAGRACTP